MEMDYSKSSSNEMAAHRTHLADMRTEKAESRSNLAVARSHLANERTHLAYMRTGISLVSLGITMNRFSWFLMDNKAISQEGGGVFLRDAKNVGLGMVVLGSAMLVWSLVRYNANTRAIDESRYTPSHRSILVFTLLVILMGIGSVIWLIV